MNQLSMTGNKYLDCKIIGLVETVNNRKEKLLKVALNTSLQPLLFISVLCALTLSPYHS